MPIIDAFASLGKSGRSVRDYFQCANNIHVLRMIAVLPRQSANQSHKDLAQLRSQSITPGLGGFPNAVLCSCDLVDTSSIEQLVNGPDAQILGGVVHSLDSVGTEHEFAQALESLDLLAQHNLICEFISESFEYQLAEKFAKARPQTSFVVNIDLRGFIDSNLESIGDCLQRLSAYHNVHIKLFGAELSQPELEQSIENGMGHLLEWFGNRRILFGSGHALEHGIKSAVEVQNIPGQDDEQHSDTGTMEVSTVRKSVTFDQLWQTYLDKTSNLSATTRDNLFRSNAMRLYLK